MTNEMEALPPICCPNGGGNELVPLLIVLSVVFAVYAATQWIRSRKGKTEMKKWKNGAIVAVLLLALAVVFALKQNRPAAMEQVQLAKPSPIASGAEAPVTLPRLVDLGADKCIPCKMMAPIFEDLKTAYAGQLQVDFIDVWKNPDAGEQYGIR